MLAIKTENLSKKYKNKLVVDKINLSIEEGKLFSLLGVNGAGKTTTIKMLSCLIKPTQGDAFIHGYNVQTQSIKAKEVINVSPQETAVAPNLTVKENLELICGLYGDNRRTSKEKTEKIIEQFSFGEIKNQKARTLSGGWQRRLSIAMAIISEPQVLFLDEPTLGLDVIARRELWNVIEKLKSKMTIILTTHYLEEAEALSDEIGIMSKGKLVAVGSVEELKKQAGIDNFEEVFISLCQKGEE